jgi:purine-binding chemotaxis protein CheW
MQNAQPKTAQTRSPERKFLTFALGRAAYGIDVLKTREIIRLVDITEVPQMPDYVKGVINLRGRIIPVIDLRLRFALGAAESTERTCIVVVQVALPGDTSLQMGLVVDGVEEVINLSDADIEAPPYFGAGLRTECILGMAKVKDLVKTLLDIDRVVAAETLAGFQAVLESPR